jgi:hypothetical protein
MKPKKSITEELTKRGAAGLAKTTAGRSRVVSPNKKTYKRREKTQKEDQ